MTPPLCSGRERVVLDQLAADGFTTTVPLIVLPWIVQWYLNSPSLSNFTELELSFGLISPVSKVLPSSSEVAVWFVNALLVHTIEPPTGNLHTLWIVTDALHLDRDWFCVRLLGRRSFSSADQATDTGKDKRKGDCQTANFPLHNDLRYGHQGRQWRSQKYFMYSINACLS